MNTRKGFFFTLLIVILFFYMLSSIRTWVKGEHDALLEEPMRLREASLTSFQRGVEIDAARVAAIAGTNALQAVDTLVAYNVTRLGNATREVGEVMQNSTLNGSACFGVPIGTCMAGSPSCCYANQTQKAAFRWWGDRLTEEFAQYDVAAAFSETNAAVYMQSPYSARVSFNLTLSMNDSRGAASYFRVIAVVGDANIAGLEDPLFPLANSSLHRNITACAASPVSPLAVGSNGTGWVYGNVTNKGSAPACGSIAGGDKAKILVLGTVPTGCDSAVNSFGGVIFNASSMAIANITVPNTYNYTVDTTALLANGTYVLLNNNDDGSRHEILNVSVLRGVANGTGCYSPTQAGPDFLRRLENSSAASVRGIESFVNFTIVNGADVGAAANRSWVDYYYFNSTACGGGCYRIRGTQNCENTTQCADNALSHFRLDNRTTLYNLTQTHLQYYGLENLTYNQE